MPTGHADFADVKGRVVEVPVEADEFGRVHYEEMAGV